jgi:hypothetical protein
MKLAAAMTSSNPYYIHLKTTSNNFDVYYEQALPRLAAFQKFAVFHPILLTSEAFPSIRISSLSLRNQLFDVAKKITSSEGDSIRALLKSLFD